MNVSLASFVFCSSSNFLLLIIYYAMLTIFVGAVIWLREEFAGRKLSRRTLGRLLPFFSEEEIKEYADKQLCSVEEFVFALQKESRFYEGFFCSFCELSVLLLGLVSTILGYINLFRDSQAAVLISLLFLTPLGIALTFIGLYQMDKPHPILYKIFGKKKGENHAND